MHATSLMRLRPTSETLFRATAEPDCLSPQSRADPFAPYLIGKNDGVVGDDGLEPPTLSV